MYESGTKAAYSLPAREVKRGEAAFNNVEYVSKTL
jgi:hypothetical protein